VFYRRIWNIVGKYSILCCDNPQATPKRKEDAISSAEKEKLVKSKKKKV
jgi:hypothetical protein